MKRSDVWCPSPLASDVPTSSLRWPRTLSRTEMLNGEVIRLDGASGCRPGSRLAVTEELSPADRSSLAAERGAINMAAGGLLVFDPEPSLTRAMVATRIAERIHLVPRLRQRLEEAPLGLANPVWVDDEGFDLDWHIRQASIPEPGGEAELGRLVGREFSHRLDRSRPLWEATLIEGLGAGRKGLLMKVHHALVDGVAAIGMAALVLDPSEEPLEIEPPEQEWAPRKYELRRHLAKLAGKPLARAPRLMVDGMLRALDPDPRRAAGDMRRATEVALELARARPQAPMTPLNEPDLARTGAGYALGPRRPRGAEDRPDERAGWDGQSGRPPSPWWRACSGGYLEAARPARVRALDGRRARRPRPRERA